MAIPTFFSPITIGPGTTTDNPTLWLKLARVRYESLTARIEAREASQQVLARWEQDRRVLAQEIRRVRAQMPKDRSFGETQEVK
jgi:hypothetical protein